MSCRKATSTHGLLAVTPSAASTHKVHGSQHKQHHQHELCWRAAHSSVQCCPILSCPADLFAADSYQFTAPEFPPFTFSQKCPQSSHGKQYSNHMSVGIKQCRPQQQLPQAVPSQAQHCRTDSICRPTTPPQLPHAQLLHTYTQHNTQFSHTCTAALLCSSQHSSCLAAHHSRAIYADSLMTFTRQAPCHSAERCSNLVQRMNQGAVGCM